MDVLFRSVRVIVAAVLHLTGVDRMMMLDGDVDST